MFSAQKRGFPPPKLKFHPRKRITVLIFYIPQIFLKKKHLNENPNTMITASLQGLSKEDRGKACRAEDQGESRQRPPISVDHRMPVEPSGNHQTWKILELHGCGSKWKT